MLLRLRRTLFTGGQRFKVRTPEDRDGTEVPDDTWPLPVDAKVWDGDEWVDIPQPDYSHIKGEDKDNKQHEAADKKAKDELAAIVKDAKTASKKMRSEIPGFDKQGNPLNDAQYDPSTKEKFAPSQGNKPQDRLAKVEPKAVLDL